MTLRCYEHAVRGLEYVSNGLKVMLHHEKRAFFGLELSHSFRSVLIDKKLQNFRKTLVFASKSKVV